MRLRLAAVWLAFLAGDAVAVEFETRAAAMDYIAAALPKATSANPLYLTKADGTVSSWLTEAVSFRDNGSEIVMRERFTQTKAGKATDGRHEATFSLTAVTVSEFTEPGDVTPSGEPAKGILFTCLKPGCVAAVWGEAPSRADKTDISIQDASTRARLLAAFRRLQVP